MRNNKYDFNDLLITPSSLTLIESRKDIKPHLKNGNLPIITAPMDTVVDWNNFTKFLDNKINVCLPRNSEIGYLNSLNRGRIFESVSLDDFIDKYVNDDITKNWFPTAHTKYLLIDIANGHMKKLVDAVKKAKSLYRNSLFLMVGNVANPITYHLLSNAGADAVRVGIGNGNGCLTTQQTGIGYPMASLIKECRNIKVENELTSLIIADGGMKTYSDIIKALALGADMVMVGSILNKALESCGETKIFKYFKINPNGKIAKWAMKNNIPLTKRFRGMSTKEVQQTWGSKILKTSEGVVKVRRVEYTLNSWVNNFEDYLRSAMSYTDSKTLKDFIGEVQIETISEQAYKRFNK